MKPKLVTCAQAFEKRGDKWGGKRETHVTPPPEQPWERAVDEVAAKMALSQGRQIKSSFDGVRAARTRSLSTENPEFDQYSCARAEEKPEFVNPDEITIQVTKVEKGKVELVDKQVPLVTELLADYQFRATNVLAKMHSRMRRKVIKPREARQTTTGATNAKAKAMAKERERCIYVKLADGTEEDKWASTRMITRNNKYVEEAEFIFDSQVHRQGERLVEKGRNAVVVELWTVVSGELIKRWELPPCRKK